MLTITQPFWRKEPFSDEARNLLDELTLAHEASAQRQNISTFTFQNVAQGSGDYTRGLAAALLSLGGIHAPLEQTMELLRDARADATAADMVDSGLLVPGWGNSFVKGMKDPLWIHVDAALHKDFEPLWDRLESVTAVLHGMDVMIYPNPSAYTAAAALAVGLPDHLAAYLFVVGRLDGWTSQLLRKD